MNWLDQACQKPCENSRQVAITRQQHLTKPAGSLGQLEQLAIQLASLQNTDKPTVNSIAISIFAADHGVADEGVSAFPQVVTAEMIKNFTSSKTQPGGAAISVLARHLNASLRVVNLGTADPQPDINGVEKSVLGPGTNNFCHQPAMNEQQLKKALNIGKQHIDEAKQTDEGCDLFIGGEMGIANTTTATTLACLLLNQSVSELVGPGTGIDKQTLEHKKGIIGKALTLHRHETSPLDALRCVGGFEIAALTGAYIRAAQLGLPVLVDGFIASIAALTAIKIKPEVQPWLILGHQSAEPGHQIIIAALNLQPVLTMSMRLGEASGAACAVPLLQLACKLHNEMATFDSANISISQTNA